MLPVGTKRMESKKSKVALDQKKDEKGEKRKVSHVL